MNTTFIPARQKSKIPFLINHIQTRLTTVDFSTIFSTVMASIHKRPRSPYWHASFLGPDGRWMLRSTKLESRHAALAMASELERAARSARRGELVEAQARKALDDIMVRSGIGETLRNVSIKFFFETWLTGKGARKSKGTGKRYRATVPVFLESLGKTAPANPSPR